MPEKCYHCNEDIPPGFHAELSVSGTKQSFCCYGCQAIAEVIVTGGLENFYQHRTQASDKPDEFGKAQQDELLLYDDPSLQIEFVETRDNVSEAFLSIGNITCAACIWLLEREINQLKGVQQFTINHSSHRARLIWQQDACLLSTILIKIRKLGYKAYPYQDDLARQQAQQEKKTTLFRIAIAGIATMQSMMLSIPLYLGAFSGIETEYVSLFRWVSLLVCTPVVLFSAQPFFKAALRDLRTRHLTMDIPVSLAISAAYLSSAYVTVFSDRLLESDVYFDSVAMFTFFLLLGRFFEMQARHKHLNSDADINQLLPVTAIIKTADGETGKPAHQIQVGDVLIIRQGQVAPADGIVLEGESHFDESALTGEFLPVLKTQDSFVSGGTANIENTLLVKTTATQKQSRIAAIIKMLDQAQSEKPKTVQLADQVASYFVAFVLLSALVVGGYWYFTEPEAVFTIVLSVLVVTCPCALSLATPTAMTTVNTFLRSRGFLITKSHALEAMTHTSDIIFDKTGTLTEGTLKLDKTATFHGIDQETALSIAAGLEDHSNHPIAHAFKAYFKESACDVKTQLGYGLQGTYQGKNYRLGNLDYVLDSVDADENLEKYQGSNVFLSEIHTDGNTSLIAQFMLADTIREESFDCVRMFQEQGIRVHILSGDHPDSVKYTAGLLGIKYFRAQQTPQQKLDYVNTLQGEGKSIAMVGDGINDLPVLSGARLSIAMGGASDITKLNSDAILLNDHMQVLNLAFQSADRARKIIKQNMTWAITYNLLMLPMAAMGWIPPYFAALGMSLSSLVVVFNSLRLKS